MSSNNSGGLPSAAFRSICVAGYSNVVCTVISSSNPTIAEEPQPSSSSVGVAATATTSSSAATPSKRPVCTKDKLASLKREFSKMAGEVISSILSDETFAISSPLATAAVSEATAMHIYVSSDENKDVLARYCGSLFDMLASCLNDKYKRSEFQREKMWSKYHQLRISDKYVKFWNSFTTTARGSPASPIFYQYVGNKLFNMLIKEYYSIHCSGDDVDVHPLTYIEKNALRYVAGNVCHSVRIKVIKIKNIPLKRKLLIAIGDLEEDRDSVPSDATSGWMREVDRGGLFHVNDKTYKLFHCMEMLVRGVFHKDNISNIDSETKDRLVSSILHDQEICSHWTFLMEEVEHEEADVLLKMVVELYITIRGFSFTKTLVEEYKQVTKKTTQKSKALRKTVVSESTD